MHVFLDTNIYLSYYELRSDSMLCLYKLLDAVRSGQITLYVSDVVLDEFDRRRERLLARISDDIRKGYAFPQMPSFCGLEDGFAAMDRRFRELELLRLSFLEDLSVKALERTLEIDGVIEGLFSFAARISTYRLRGAAKQRSDFGRAPGKRASYGDALNWLGLLRAVPSETPLYFVSRDSDFYSPLRPDALSDPLWREWMEKKRSVVYAATSLSAFFRMYSSDLPSRSRESG